MAILQALRPKTLTRSIVFAGLCLIVVGAVVLVWMLQFMDAKVANPPITYTRKNGVHAFPLNQDFSHGQSDQDKDHVDTFVDLYGGQTLASSAATGSTPNTVGRQNSVTELDPATQAHIREIVAAADAEQSYQVKTLDNDYFVSHSEVTDGGQELTGYFKNGDIQKIAYSVGLSFGLQKYLYYFDRGELVYVSVEEDDYPATNEGLDYEKTEPVFSGEYFFLNGKLLKTNAKGQGRYLSASTTNAGDGLMESATRYSALLAK